MSNLPCSLLSIHEYKERFFPDLSPEIFSDKSKVQVFPLQNLREILPVERPYKVSFGYVIFVTQGFVIQELDKKQYVLKSNTCTNIHQETYTRTLEVSKNAEGYIIVYNIISSFCSFSKTEVMNIKSEDIDTFITSVELLRKEVLRGKKNFMVVLNILNSILYRILDYQAYSIVDVKNAIITNNFKRIVEENFMENKTISFYAKQLNVSTSYLNKILSRTLKKTAKRYINEFCIEQSKILLQDFSKNIAEVAYGLNFESASYYSRLFKQLNGITPKEFRQSLQKDVY